MNPGLTILLRAGDDLAGSRACLDSLAAHNSYKPLEVLLWAKVPQEAVSLVRALLPRLFVRVLPGSVKEFARLAQQARHEHLLILDPAARFQADVLGDWLQRQRSEAPASLLCQKAQLAALSGRPLSLALDQLASALGQSTPPAAKSAAKPAAKPQPAPQPATAKAPAAPAGKAPPEPELIQQIKEIEAAIQRLETQLAQIDQDTAALEARYLPLTDNSPEKQELKDQLEEHVLTSCRLLVQLKEAQDYLLDCKIGCKYLAGDAWLSK